MISNSPTFSGDNFHNLVTNEDNDFYVTGHRAESLSTLIQIRALSMALNGQSDEAVELLDDAIFHLGLELDHENLDGSGQFEESVRYAIYRTHVRRRQVQSLAIQNADEQVRLKREAHIEASFIREVASSEWEDIAGPELEDSLFMFITNFRQIANSLENRNLVRQLYATVRDDFTVYNPQRADATFRFVSEFYNIHANFALRNKDMKTFLLSSIQAFFAEIAAGRDGTEVKGPGTSLNHVLERLKVGNFSH